MGSMSGTALGWHVPKESGVLQPIPNSTLGSPGNDGVCPCLVPGTEFSGKAWLSVARHGPAGLGTARHPV